MNGDGLILQFGEPREPLPARSRRAIAPYSTHPPSCVEYDPRTAEVAQRVIRSITRVIPWVAGEHIGSTAVPGCAGKGIVDLMVVYPNGQLEAVKDGLSGLGFQRQTIGHIHPETRPMRVGEISFGGQSFCLHVHVLAASSPEVTSMRAFRERLCADPALMAAYVARKRAILATGIIDARAYTEMKSVFVLEVLAARPDSAEGPTG
jgi:GrpB-like predicted nucleotidyltransferase (UPF0157 family)